ncbi:hypothetical protein HJC23_003485 [Cyclotella cryptica]|uniref:Fe2OG dioxygenase domain-containing protein n=1 Tax=Cyclotella cryptica TaxID=29204 RepID=A0ABD3QSJ9_9STRA|eukprot:CCRYP_002632-RA/>CCRYP_002632-RA protein AED:0.27 eAED:0.27 QI:361/1/1/1/0.5/0.4/5/2046/627
MGYNNSLGELVEEKKEHDSMDDANFSPHNSSQGQYKNDQDKASNHCEENNNPVHHNNEKIKMVDSFEMEENEGDGRQQQQQHGEGQQQQSNAQVFDFSGTPHQTPQQQLSSNSNNISSNGLMDQAAQQLLSQTAMNQQHQLQQSFQHPGISLDSAGLSVLTPQMMAYLAQTPSNSALGSVNLLAMQHALAQHHQQTAVQAQTSALIGCGGVTSPLVLQHSSGFITPSVPSLVDSIASSGFTFGQHLQNQQQPQQQQHSQQVAGHSGNSIVAPNMAHPPTVFGNTQQVAAFPPNNYATSTTTAVPPPLFSGGSFAAPSILGPSLPSLLTNLNRHTLSPQLTIPHYIPPTPASWGAPLPTLTVQDRPLVPPIYNGINPNYPKAQMLHSHPPVFCVHDFLTPAECDFLIEAASDAFGPAPVVGKGQGEVSPSRTSSTCYLAREDLPEYLRKVSLLTGKPAEHCELPQVGRYLPSQQYLQHFDAFDLSNEDGRRFAANGGQRTVTVLTYLNDVAIGGATAFPNLNLQVQPRRGMALVFFPSTLDGLLDKMALHAALPAVDIKYVSQVWIRQTNYDGRPSKRLTRPMVAGLQEQREREELEKSVHAQILLGQFGLQQASAVEQQQLHRQQES